MEEAADGAPLPRTDAGAAAGLLIQIRAMATRAPATMIAPGKVMNDEAGL